MATFTGETAQPDVLASTDRTRLVAEVLALSPLAILFAIALDGTLAELPGSSALVAVTSIWTLVGVFVITQTRSPLTQSVALLGFAIPATVTAVVGTWLALASVPPV